MDFALLGQTASQILIDYFAVMVGVLTGVLYALDRKFDIVGTVALGLIAGYGGGIIRDMLLQNQGFFFMERPDLVVVSIAISVAAFLLGKRITNIERALFYADAFSMALFALAGTTKAYSVGVGVVMSVVLGVITAVGGGMLRNICSGDVPAIFKPGNYYALSAFAGAVLYVASTLAGLPSEVGSIACVAAAFALTVLSARFDWRTKPGGE